MRYWVPHGLVDLVGLGLTVSVVFTSLAIAS